jgi:hypothetical protein
VTCLGIFVRASPASDDLGALHELIAEHVVAVGMGVDELADVAAARTASRIVLSICAVSGRSNSVSTSKVWSPSATSPALLQPQEPSGCKKAKQPRPRSCSPFVYCHRLIELRPRTTRIVAASIGSVQAAPHCLQSGKHRDCESLPRGPRLQSQGRTYHSRPRSVRHNSRQLRARSFGGISSN